jgi:glycosyltransferase involved in cell wall biosynthesis
MKVCLVAFNIYPMLTGDYREQRIGGAELQQINIAKSLVEQGTDVSIVCLDHGQPDGQTVDGIVVWKSFREDSGVPLVRFLHPRVTSLWAALARANADVYYSRCASYVPGILRVFCGMTGKKHVFASALDTDFVPGLESVPNLRDRLLYRYGLRGADQIVVQSTRQQELLRQNYSLPSVVSRNFLLDPRESIPASAKRTVLWVSTIRNRKRPLHFVRLAARFPKERFVMVGGRLDSHAALYEEVLAASRSVPNLEFMGFQPYEKVEALFDECKIFVNTSLHEGFPNTYLQAWRREIPVISFFDPDDVIREQALGRVVEDEEQLAGALAALLETCHEYGHAGEYYLANHSALAGVRLGQVFGRLIEDRAIA